MSISLVSGDQSTMKYLPIALTRTKWIKPVMSYSMELGICFNLATHFTFQQLKKKTKKKEISIFWSLPRFENIFSFIYLPSPSRTLTIITPCLLFPLNNFPLFNIPLYPWSTSHLEKLVTLLAIYLSPSWLVNNTNRSFL